MGELIMMVLLLRIMKSQGKGKVRVSWRKEEEEEEEEETSLKKKPGSFFLYTEG